MVDIPDMPQMPNLEIPDAAVIQDNDSEETKIQKMKIQEQIKALKIKMLMDMASSVPIMNGSKLF